MLYPGAPDVGRVGAREQHHVPQLLLGGGPSPALAPRRVLASLEHGLADGVHDRHHQRHGRRVGDPHGQEHRHQHEA